MRRKAWAVKLPTWYASSVVKVYSCAHRQRWRNHKEVETWISQWRDCRWFSFSLYFSAFSKFSTKTNGASMIRSIYTYGYRIYLLPVFRLKEVICFYIRQDHSTFWGKYLRSPKLKTFVSDLGFNYLGIHVPVRPFYVELKFRSLLPVRLSPGLGKEGISTSLNPALSFIRHVLILLPAPNPLTVKQLLPSRLLFWTGCYDYEFICWLN